MTVWISLSKKKTHTRQNIHSVVYTSLCSLVGICQRFGAVYCHRLHGGKWKQYVLLKFIIVYKSTVP